MSRIGVFICHCGENIGATVDCIKVTELAANMEGVAYAVDYKYMCSDPGQTLIKNAIKEYDLGLLQHMPDEKSVHAYGEKQLHVRLLTL